MEHNTSPCNNVLYLLPEVVFRTCRSAAQTQCKGVQACDVLEGRPVLYSQGLPRGAQMYRKMICMFDLRIKIQGALKSQQHYLNLSRPL